MLCIDSSDTDIVAPLFFSSATFHIKGIFENLFHFVHTKQMRIALA